MKIAIVGAGELGWKVADALVEGDHSVTVIDQDEKELQKLSSQLDVMTINANAKEIEVLDDMGIEHYDYLVSVTENDETNIVIASIAKKLGCTKVTARLRDPEYMDQMDFIKNNFHIDNIVNPASAVTVEIFKYLVEKYTLSNGRFSSGKISLLEFNVEKMPELINYPIQNITALLPGMLVVAIDRGGKIIVPHGDDIIEEDDNLYVIGERLPIAELRARVYERGRYTNIHKVMIIGGGRTGYYLAQQLSEFGAAVKIIEQNKERCHYLSTHLDDVMILHGDATDLDLLEEENIDEMDAVVTATSYDEDNLLLALIAKQHGVDDVIAKISKDSYADLVSKIGIDMVLNPNDISTNTIVRFIQGSKRIISSVMIQGQAELLEIVANDRMEELIDMPINKMSLPEGMLVAAIHRGNDVIIPKGDTVIQENDRVIIFSLLSELPEVEALLSVSEPRFPFFRKRR